MTTLSITSPVETIRRYGHPLAGEPQDFDPLFRQIGDAHFVLLGSATHGTHEFYRIRAEITKRLIREKGFSAVAVEADWADAFRVNRFVRGYADDAEASDALAGFQRFPHWMWRNADVLDFVGWLRAFNDAVMLPRKKAGFYGLDISAAVSSRQPACARPRDDAGDPEAVFCAEQNARVLRNGERYHEALMRGAGTWNLREWHMAGTIEALHRHLRVGRDEPRIVIWAHSAHVGDARWTEMASREETSLGELVRVRHPYDVVSVGLTTFTGSVTAADDWNAPARRMQATPGLPDSYEALLHAAVDGGEMGSPNILLSFDENHASRGDLRHALDGPMLERAIGAIYHPETERESHYFAASLPRQFDAVLHYDVTRAVEPLERTGRNDPADAAETFPSAL